MLLVSVLVLTNTVSADGSIGGVYKAGVQLAERTSGQANTEIRELTDTTKQTDSSEDQKPAVPPPPTKDQSEQQDQKSGAKSDNSRKNH